MQGLKPPFLQSFSPSFRSPGDHAASRQSGRHAGDRPLSWSPPVTNQQVLLGFPGLRREPRLYRKLKQGAIE